MHRRRAIAALGAGLVGLPGLARAAAGADGGWRPPIPRGAPPADYVAWLAPDLSVLVLDVHRPDRLVPGAPQGRALLIEAQVIAPDGPPRPLALEGGALPARPGAVVRLVFDARALSEASIGGMRGGAPGVVHLWPALWLWRPRALRGGPRTLAFRVGDHRLSTAWPRRADGLWRLERSAFRYKSRVIVGAFEQWSVPIHAGHAEVAWLGDPRLRPTLAPWVAAAARGVAALHPDYPAHAQIVLFDEPGDDIGFGAALRGGGGGVSVWVGRTARPATIRDDWTLVHELLHLGMPHLQGADAWLSEGVTQYHTHVAQARGGILTPEQAWGELHAGFARGRGAAAGQPLAFESAALDRRYNYWFVYWAGAAFALRLDVWLRSQGRDLAGLLAHWYREEGGCCAGERTAERLIAAADRWTRSATPSALAREAMAMTAMPDPAALYAGLGVAADGRLAPGDSPGRRLMTGRG